MEHDDIKIIWIKYVHLIQQVNQFFLQRRILDTFGAGMEKWSGSWKLADTGGSEAEAESRNVKGLL